MRVRVEVLLRKSKICISTQTTGENKVDLFLKEEMTEPKPMAALLLARRTAS